MDKKLVSLSRVISLALRHKPQQYQLQLDTQGWIDLEILLAAIRKKHGALSWAERESVEQIIRQSDKKRFEIKAGRIRAQYGHSLQEKIEFPLAEPPPRLYHGTTAEAAGKILEDGLKSMSRQYVHLSVDESTATMVARRRTRHPVIFVIEAKDAFRHGIGFYAGKDAIWMSDDIPVEFIAEQESSR